MIVHNTSNQEWATNCFLINRLTKWFVLFCHKIFIHTCTLLLHFPFGIMPYFKLLLTVFSLQNCLRHLRIFVSSEHFLFSLPPPIIFDHNQIKFGESPYIRAPAPKKKASGKKSTNLVKLPDISSHAFRRFGFQIELGKKGSCHTPI